MTRDEVLEAVHSYATITAFEGGDGHMSVGMSSYNGYLAKFEQGKADLLHDDGLIPADQITSEIYFRYINQRLWTEQELLRNPDQRIQREVEYDIARRGGKKARDAYWAKWESIELPGDELVR